MESMSSLELDSGLPIILPKLTGANIHDGVATIDLVGELVKQGYRIRYSVFDSTYDNYHFYLILVDYCQISPIIYLNKRCQGISYNKDLIFFIQDGIPMCLYGLPLANWGFCSGYKVATSGAVQYVLLFNIEMRSVLIEVSAKRKSQTTAEYFTPTPKRTTVTSLLFHGIANFGMNFYRKRGVCERSFKIKKVDYKLAIARTRGKGCGSLE